MKTKYSVTITTVDKVEGNSVTATKERVEIRGWDKVIEKLQSLNEEDVESVMIF